MSGTAPGSAASPIRYLHNEPAGLGSGVPALNQPTSVVWQDGAVRRYHYENTQFPQRLTGRTDELGVRIGSYTYNTSGQLVRSAGPSGMNTVDFAYLGSTTQVTDRGGATPTTSTYTWEEAAGVIRPTAVSAPCPQCGSTSARTAYNASGDVVWRVDHDGRITFYLYDAKGRETERATYPAAYNTATTRPALNLAERVVSTKWHATWNLPTQVAEPQKVTAYTYGTGGRLTGESWTATTDATGAAKFAAVKTGSTFATGYSYNTNSLVTSWVEKIDATTVAQMTYTVNAAGNATKATNTATAQSTSSASYDAQGRLTREVDPLGIVTRTYTPRGLVLEERDESVTTTVTHNAIGLVTELNSGTGNVWNWTYRPDHRVQSVTLNGSVVATYASLTTNRWENPSWIDFFVATAHAQAGVAPPAPAGGGLGPAGGRLILLPLLWELGKRLKDSSLPTEDRPGKDEDCDPCKDPSKRPGWTEYDAKHRKNRGQSWSDIRAKTALPPPRGAATYHPAQVPNATAQLGFEYDVWQRGKVIVNDKSKTHKVVRFGFVVGAYKGMDTTCAIVKCSAKEIHGHPTKESDCDRPEVPYP